MLDLNTVKRLAIHFWEFIRNPAKAAVGGPFPAFQTFAFVLALNIAFACVFALPVIYLIDHHVLRLKYSPNFTAPVSLFILVASIVLFAPILEETLFRYPLKLARGSVLNVLVYVSSAAFGLWHIINYANREPLFFLLSPFLLSSQLFGGFVLAYLRLQHGLRWSILAHATFNALVLGVSIIFTHGKVILDESNDSYRMYIKEYVYREERPVRFKIQRKGNGIDTIYVRQVHLQRLLDSIAINRHYYVDDVIVDVDFKSTKPLQPDSLIDLLRKEYRIE